MVPETKGQTHFLKSNQILPIDFYQDAKILWKDFGHVPIWKLAEKLFLKRTVVTRCVIPYQKKKKKGNTSTNYLLSSARKFLILPFYLPSWKKKGNAIVKR